MASPPTSVHATLFSISCSLTTWDGELPFPQLTAPLDSGIHKYWVINLVTPTPICGCPETASSICTPQSGSSDAEELPAALHGSLCLLFQKVVICIFFFSLICVFLFQYISSSFLPQLCQHTNWPWPTLTLIAIQLVRLAPQILLSKMKTNTPSFGFYRPVLFPEQTCLKNNLECQIQI